VYDDGELVTGMIFMVDSTDFRPFLGTLPLLPSKIRFLPQLQI
jgi:hypothetical protein